MGMDRAILMADVSGSTPLYERHGDQVASKLVFECVEGMQEIANRRGGEFVRSKGDDVLCLFEAPDQALIAAKEILDHGTAGSVSVHGGLHWGSVVWRGTELFGGAVNVAARLSSRAKDNEVLMSGDFTDRISPDKTIDLRPMGEITLRGTAVPTEIYALMAADESGATRLIAQTRMFDLHRQVAEAGTYIRLTSGAWSRDVSEGEEITVGRSSDCDLVLELPWVSRVHAAINVRAGLVEITDRSVAGCTLNTGDTTGYFIRRQTISLTGNGIIELGSTAIEGALPQISFAVMKISGIG
ncbi:MAG: adenylate/guanylate cyclase domain-containing protein [Aliishimia sp.]